MNQVQLRTLLAVIDEGGFDVAAATLGVSPSAVSQRIRALEKSVGRVLVKRSTPPTPTHAGEVIVEAARRMALLEAETATRLDDRLSRVALSVAVNADSLATWLRPVLADVAADGRASLRLRIEDEAHTVALLRSGEVMAAITTDGTPVSGCEVTLLGTMRYLAVATPCLRDRHRQGERLDWAQMPALRFGPNDALQDTDLDGRLAPDVPRDRRISQVPSSEAFVEACRVGLGWALLPELQAAPALDAGELVVLDGPVLEVPLYWQRWRLKSRTLDMLTRAVSAAATTQLGTAPGS